MPWYEAKAAVNYCRTDKEKADNMVAEMAKKYKADKSNDWLKHICQNISRMSKKVWNDLILRKFSKTNLKNNLSQRATQKQSITKSNSKTMARQA